MSLYLDPTGQTTFGIGICARCSKKFFLAELSTLNHTFNLQQTDYLHF